MSDKVRPYPPRSHAECDTYQRGIDCLLNKPGVFDVYTRAAFPQVSLGGNHLRDQVVAVGQVLPASANGVVEFTARD